MTACAFWIRTSSGVRIGAAGALIAGASAGTAAGLRVRRFLDQAGVTASAGRVVLITLTAGEFEDAKECAR